MIRFDNVSKKYSDDKTAAVNNVTLDIKDGEFFVFIGPSGCGKTTTLKMINRLIPLTTGTIYINEKRISDYDIHELRWDIGYVLQQIALFPHMTIEENIAIVPELKKWSKEKIHDRITELLDSVGLDPESYRHRKPAELSGGEQQRVGVVRALAADPGIILMDEPFSALDSISRQRLQQDISALQKKIKKTIVFVTHDMQEALALGDRICVMQGGEIVQVATPQEIMKNPENDFVKDFLASGHAFNTPILEANFTVKDLIEADLFYSYQTSDGTLGISSAEPVENLVRRIAEEQSIPVTDEAGNFIGTVSNKHVMQFLARHLESSGELV
ncbi:TPA: ABC transporter ATP-binding protein [Listeria monocytogenes]|nr:ABC transporter ATP-binding protein [Listeria monocytogenes]